LYSDQTAFHNHQTQGSFDDNKDMINTKLDSLNPKELTKEEKVNKLLNRIKNEYKQIRDKEIKTERHHDHKLMNSSSREGTECNDEKVLTYRKLLVPNKIDFTTDGSGYQPKK